MLVGISNDSALIEPSEILIVPRWRHNRFRAGCGNDIFLMAQMIWASSEAQVFPEVLLICCSGVS